MLLRLLVFVGCIAMSFSCKCRKLPANEAYCNADWVSHVKVIASKTVEDKMVGPRRQYTVKHIRVLKDPPGCSSLPAEVFTSSSSASCGVSLDVGKEYLLSGGCEDKTLSSGSCGQISSDDPNDNFFGIVPEWKDVSAKFLKQIEGFKC
ncbi:tissue inhibitor of metalloproteinase [Ancylostoma duodenale]|uniref:Tissue inhibitor of metalloproteinase n=1 Tax=Ancylostoma duodenale TaxID=51022 RepID=A0A0C2DWG4_9BILA|nr:tissue inhibitor of metalloproteinase [Ancylostoma duodenale]